MRHTKHYGHLLIMTATSVFALALLLLWGWNSSMPILFGLPRMQFLSALGLMILLGIVSFTIDRPWRHLKQRD